MPHGAGAYCPAHAPPRLAKARDPFYGSARWLALRRAWLREHPLCECGRLATVVDHVVPIKEGGDPLDRGNLRSLCASCHARLPGHGWRARGGG